MKIDFNNLLKTGVITQELLMKQREKLINVKYEPVKPRLKRLRNGMWLCTTARHHQVGFTPTDAYQRLTEYITWSNRNEIH